MFRSIGVLSRKGNVWSRTTVRRDWSVETPEDFGERIDVWIEMDQFGERSLNLTRTESNMRMVRGEMLTVGLISARRVFSLVIGANGECVVGE